MSENNPRSYGTQENERMAKECGGLLTPSELSPAHGSPKIVLIPMGYDEAVQMLDNLTRTWPHPLPHNVQYKQWDLMLPNLEALERDVQKAKRILAAISENE
jgi:hypothetical protein